MCRLPPGRFQGFLALAAAVFALGAEPLRCSAQEELPPADPVDLEGEPGGAPRASAALDGEPGIWSWVALSGEGTRDPEGRPQTYAWKQTEGPALNLGAEESARPRVWVLLQKPGTYGFELRARNNKGWSAACPLSFTVEEGPPVLEEREALTMAGAGERIVFPGKNWKQIYGPAVDLACREGEQGTSFWALQAGLHLFEAARPGEALERRGVRVPPGPDALTGDRRPFAELPPPMDGQVGQPLELDGSGSKDPDGDPLRARWICDDRVSDLELLPAAGLKAAFKAAREGIYRVRLVVSDGKLESEPAETFLRILGAGASPEAAASNAGLPPHPDPLSGRVTLGLYESNLDRAVQRFPADCGVTLRIGPEFCLPEQTRRVPLDLGVQDAPVSLLLDWIARQTGACYRRGPGGSVWLTTPEAWAREEKLQNVVLSVDALYAAKDGADLQALLKECFRGVFAARADASLSFEAAGQKAVAFLPEPACRRLKEILALLRAPKGLPWPAPERTADEERLRKTLSEKKINLNWQGRRLDLALRELRALAGLAVGFDARQFSKPKDLPRLSLKLEGVVLREAVREIAAAAGFDGCQPHAGAGLWFYRGGEPFPSGELLWDLAGVGTYDLEPVLAKLPLFSGEALVHQIKRRVFPDTWKDPNTCCAYHAPTRRLLVVHGEAAHVRIVRFLYDLMERGEDALGPVEASE